MIFYFLKRLTKFDDLFFLFKEKVSTPGIKNNKYSNKVSVLTKLSLNFHPLFIYFLHSSKLFTDII